MWSDIILACVSLFLGMKQYDIITMHVTIWCLLQLFMRDACLVLWLCSVVLYNSTVISFIGHHLQIACFRIVLSSNEVTEMDSWTWFDCRWAIMNVCSHAALLSIILIFMPIMLNSYSIELLPLLSWHEWYLVLWIFNYIRNIIYFRSSPKNKLSLLACYNVVPNFVWLT